MFVKYAYVAGSTAANVLADLVLLLTGTTDKTSLSANCVQATTEIFNDGSRPAGWTVFDAAAGVRSVALRALNIDGSTYKYVVLNHDNTASLYLKTYESWNATTHAGTNICSSSDSGWYATLNLAAGGILYVSASAKCIVTCGWAVGTFDTGVTAVAEHSRDEPWDTPSLGVPPYTWIGRNFNGGVGSTCSKPRIKDLTTGSSADLTGSSASAGSRSQYAYGGTGQWDQMGQVRDAAYALKHAFCPIVLSKTTASTILTSQIFGKIYDIFLTTYNFGNTGDEVQYLGKTYFIVKQASVYPIAIPKF